MPEPIRLRVEGWPPRRWHTDLAAALAGDLGVTTGFDAGPAAQAPMQTYIGRVLALERLLERTDQRYLAPTPMGPPDPRDDGLVVDLSADPEPPGQMWRVLFDGRPGHTAAAQAITHGRLPVVTVIDPAGSVRAEGRPGTEQPGLLSAALGDVLTGTGSLLAAALAGRAVCPPTPEAGEPERARPKRLGRLAIEKMAHKTLHAGYRMLTRSPHWRVGWRPLLDAEESTSLTGHLPLHWASLPDDGYHFYADPFLFEHQGRAYLFVEDFDHRVGRAHISVVEMGDDGPRGTPFAVLTRDVHLSYPFVLEDRGDIWMIPETSGANRIEIFRAVRFPDRWAHEAVLVDDVTASDATPVHHDGRWWMFATVWNGGSYSDHLHLWSAPELLGPWLPHPANPVLIDIASARPAGRFIHHDGRLLRPTQDGRGGYGAALNIMEVTRLDEYGFTQRPLANIVPGAGWQGRRIHTLNQSERFEVVDGSRVAPRVTILRRALDRMGIP